MHDKIIAEKHIGANPVARSIYDGYGGISRRNDAKYQPVLNKDLL